jgi:hypothetical protein
MSAKIYNTAAQLRECEDNHGEQCDIHVAQQLNKEFPIIEANAIVDPWAVMIHVQNAAIANAAVVSAVWLPHIAHLAVSPSLRLVTHVKTPIGRYDARIRHDALIEREHEIAEQDMIEEEYEC